MVPFPFLGLMDDTTTTTSKKLMGVSIQNPNTMEIHQLFIMVRDVLECCLKFGLHPERWEPMRLFLLVCICVVLSQTSQDQIG